MHRVPQALGVGLRHVGWRDDTSQDGMSKPDPLTVWYVVGMLTLLLLVGYGIPLLWMYLM